MTLSHLALAVAGSSLLALAACSATEPAKRDVDVPAVPARHVPESPLQAVGSDDAEELTAYQRSFRDCPRCPEMVIVPLGSYLMGSPTYEQGRTEDEGPIHEVTISAPFAIGRHEVTVAEFSRFVDETGYSAESQCVIYSDGNFEPHAGVGWRTPGFAQSNSHPVVCVSWNDAQTYAAWLSRWTGKEYRLPSEAEWEYAARAGTVTARHWGASHEGQCLYANGVDATMVSLYPDSVAVQNAVSCSDGHVYTAPVGSFAPNAGGIHDMLGNVWEWTDDCWNRSYTGRPSSSSAWESGQCGARVLRGGSWNSGPSDLRSAARLWITTHTRIYFNGFRVARAVTP